MMINFKFKPLQHVRVLAYGLNYAGRIIRCEYSGNKSYNVEYAADGKIETRMFYEDELGIYL